MKALFNKIFCKKDINNDRQIEIDIAKAICIFGMAIVHIFETALLLNPSFGDGEFLSYLFVYILNTCFGASIFMVCMGLGLAYTKKSSPMQIIKRGFVMFLVSFVFNFFRFTIVDILMEASAGEFNFPYLVSSVFFVDILTFAGLALMLFGLLKLFKTPYWLLLIIALSMSTLGTIFQAVPTNSWATTLFICPFLPVAKDPIINYNAYFPLFNWFVFVVLGYGFGLLLKRVQNKGLFYAIVSGTCGLFAIIYLAICIPSKCGLCYPEITNTMFIKIYDALICFIIAIAVFGLYYALSHILAKVVKKFISFLSKGITGFYVIHWLTISTLTILVFSIDETWQIPNVYICLPIGIGVFIISCLILFAFNKIKEKIKLKRTNKNA